ncbi:hypothetical protein TNCT_451081 [Trichonephila clavata]|uniref:Uncharacterized protein n=1 Tax=Trichonephila clavata TaxID=2740835 RepID=A0A8X6I8E3_TRICU|nr:hypothetical protein TNCT_451081 [Trichonephila clavata]
MNSSEQDTNQGKMSESHISCKTAATRLQEAGHKLDDLYIGFQLKGGFLRNSSLPCNKFTDGKKGLHSCQNEAELILEANRLQLMKQDLEKTRPFTSAISYQRRS